MRREKKKHVPKKKQTDGDKAADAYIGMRLRVGRTMRSKSQEKLGDLLGITFQQIQKYEKGTNRIGGSRLVKICNVLDLPVNFFFEGMPGYIHTKSNELDDAIQTFLMSGEGMRVLHGLNGISDHELRAIVVRLVERAAAIEAMADVQDPPERRHTHRVPAHHV
jgi:transcriptional regulator with XRE-family HTH domain